MEFSGGSARLVVRHADTEQGLDHAHGVPYESELGTLLMRPAHRHLRDLHIEYSYGNVEHLDVESEMIHPAATEDLFRSTLGEKLEPALRIMDAGDCHQLDELV